MKKIIFLTVLTGALILVACNKDKENQGEAVFTATTEHLGGRTSLDPNNGQINWMAGDRIVIGNDNDETATFSLRSGEGTTEGGFGTADDFNTVGPFVAAYPETATIANDVVTFNLPATQAIGETGTFANGANPMVACSDDKNLQFKNLCGGLGIRLKGVGAHVSAVRITSKNTSEKLWGTFEVSNCAANEPTLTEAANNQGSNVITLTCNVTLTTAAKTFFVMLPPGTLANGFTTEVLDGNEVLTTKETTSDIALVERNNIKCFDEILIDVEFDGNIEIPTGMEPSDIIITNFGEDAIPDENGDFAIGYSKMLVAKNADNGKVMYYSIHSIENGSKDASDNDYEINAKETALFFAIRLFPLFLKDGYDDVLLKVKESLYTLPCVTQLENAIRNTVATYGYLKEDEIATAVHNVADFFYNEFVSVQTAMLETKEEPSPTKLDPPCFSPNHRHGVRMNINESQFLENPQRWSINCTGYSSQFCALGIVEGYLNDNDVFIKKEGKTPYYMPPMGMSQYAKLAENVAFMTMPGNWAGLLQLYRKVKQAVNDPDYLLELTHVTYENMTFEVPRTANAIGVLSPMDDDYVAVATAVYMAYDVFTLIPTVGAYPIESIVNAYMQDGDFVNLVRVQRHNGEAGWAVIIEAMNDKIDEITLSIAPDIPLDIINSLTPIGTVCSGLDLFLAAITWGTLNTFALPVVTDFPISELPIVTVTSVDAVSGQYAHVEARIVDEGAHSISAKGVCYSTSPEPDLNDNVVEGTYYGYGNNQFYCDLEDLEPNTTYYVRAYAQNWLQLVAYSEEEVSFTTQNVPTVTTLAVTNITNSSATANARVTFSNMSQIVERGFLYGTSDEGLWYGNVGSDAVVYEGTSQNAFNCSLTGLDTNTKYYVKAYAKTAEGIGYGDTVSFTTMLEGGQTFTITATANPTDGGTVTGGGIYNQGQSCTLIATANGGYTFSNWTENGAVVSADASYTFTVNSDRGLVANFTANGGGGGGGGQVPTGAINGKFTINENGDQVYFSQGNLQYIGSAASPYWKFADHQWDYFGDNGQGSTLETSDRDLFGWGTSGYNHGANCYQPWNTSNDFHDYYAYGSYTNNLYDQTGQADWGYNPIINGGNTENSGWYTLPINEWAYIFETRITASGIHYAKALVNNVGGVIIVPDDWNESIYNLSNPDISGASYSSNVITAAQWTHMENAGAVFLPAAGSRTETTVYSSNMYGCYWSASIRDVLTASRLGFHDTYLYPASDYLGRGYGHSVRLVRPVE